MSRTRYAFVRPDHRLGYRLGRHACDRSQSRARRSRRGECCAAPRARSRTSCDIARARGNGRHPLLSLCMPRNDGLSREFRGRAPTHFADLRKGRRNEPWRPERLNRGNARGHSCSVGELGRPDSGRSSPGLNWRDCRLGYRPLYWPPLESAFLQMLAQALTYGMKQLQFRIVAFCMIVPAGYCLVRTLFAAL